MPLISHCPSFKLDSLKIIIHHPFKIFLSFINYFCYRAEVITKHSHHSGLSLKNPRLSTEKDVLYLVQIWQDPVFPSHSSDCLPNRNKKHNSSAGFSLFKCSIQHFKTLESKTSKCGFSTVPQTSTTNSQYQHAINIKPNNFYYSRSHSLKSIQTAI